MATEADAELAGALQRELDYYDRPGVDDVATAEEQDWLNTARLAIGFLTSSSATDEQREAARSALEHTPPQRS